MGYAIKQGQTAQPLLFKMVSSSDHVTAVTGISPTVTLSKNGGSFASPAGAVTEIGSGWYKVAGNATDAGTLGPLQLYATGTGADPTDEQFSVVAYDPQAAAGLGLTNLDTAVSSRLATSGYTAPDNAGIAAAEAAAEAAESQTTASAIRSALGMAANDLDTQLDAILSAGGSTAYVMGPYRIKPSYTEENGDVSEMGVDDSPTLGLVLTDASGDPVDLTGATMTASFRSSRSGAEISTPTVTIAHADSGLVTVAMTSTETAAAGTYHLRIVRTVGGSVQTFGPHIVIVS